MTKETLQADLIDCIKQKDTVKISTLRLILSEIEKLEKSNKSYEILTIVQKEISKRNESLTFYIKGNRLDSIALANDEIAFLQTFLPTQISEEKLIDIIKSIKEEFGFYGMKDMKSLIELVKGRVAGRIDTALIGKNCKNILN